jgi:hypothetical protein
MYYALDVVPKEQSGTARAGSQMGQVMSPEEEMCLAGNTVLRELAIRICAMWAIAPNIIAYNDSQYGSAV